MRFTKDINNLTWLEAKGSSTKSLANPIYYYTIIGVDTPIAN